MSGRGRFLAAIESAGKVSSGAFDRVREKEHHAQKSRNSQIHSTSSAFPLHPITRNIQLDPTQPSLRHNIHIIKIHYTPHQISCACFTSKITEAITQVSSQFERSPFGVPVGESRGSVEPSPPPKTRRSPGVEEEV